ncbi:MAG TPA: SRPBCC family protein [Dehalococcoidia bacterium]|nr:SRPBCC family protein [Dehalococcoidia bacterium]
MPRVDQQIRVTAPIDQVYQFWRNFENFPLFMQYVDEVTLLDPEGRRSQWKLGGPLGATIELDSELTEDVPPSVISWNSVEGTIDLCGGVTFTQANEQETLVHVLMEWSDPPAGAIGEAVGQIFANPDQMLTEDLTRFKVLVEERLAAGNPQPPAPPSGPDSHAAVASS